MRYVGYRDLLIVVIAVAMTVQFNFLSTSPSLLKCDKLPNLYTILPSEYGLVPARVALMKTFNWTRAIIFHQPIDLWSLVCVFVR